MNFSPKLKFSSVLNKKFHSTNSKAFLKSQNNIMCGSFEFSQYPYISRIVLALKPITLPLIYAV
jgi:hypothetical protein